MPTEGGTDPSGALQQTIVWKTYWIQIHPNWIRINVKHTHAGASLDQVTWAERVTVNGGGEGGSWLDASSSGCLCFSWASGVHYFCLFLVSLPGLHTNKHKTEVFSNDSGANSKLWSFNIRAIYSLEGAGGVLEFRVEVERRTRGWQQNRGEKGDGGESGEYSKKESNHGWWAKAQLMWLGCVSENQMGDSEWRWKAVWEYSGKNNRRITVALKEGHWQMEIPSDWYARHCSKSHRCEFGKCATKPREESAAD